MDNIQKTIFHERHESLGARMVEFGGWHMPLQYKEGIILEHLETRKEAGLFDVSHMGRFRISGKNALPFLQHVLTNNAEALEVGQSQYTIIPNDRGGAIDDAYLYRFYEDEYLLVVNASNKETDWEHFQTILPSFKKIKMEDNTDSLAMISLQGPQSKRILLEIIDSGNVPDPIRNHLSIITLGGAKVLVSRTGYTGEPICFELFIEADDALPIWDLLIEKGARPIGLGARDTLRLEAGLPLYGHELGTDPEGKEIPIFAVSLSRFAVSFSPRKGDFIGRYALQKQFDALKGIIAGEYSRVGDLPRLVMSFMLTDRGVAREGNRILKDSEHVGFVTSGTTVPYWKYQGDGLSSHITGERGMRSIGLALLDSTLLEGDKIDVEIRRGSAAGIIVPYHLRSEAPPYSRAIISHFDWKKAAVGTESNLKKAESLVNSTIANSTWRQQDCINLIPSEMTQSEITKVISIMDPLGRYAEHKQVKAFDDAEVFFYQGTDFIAGVEELLSRELSEYLECAEVESRLISGQMANTVLFSALMDFLNRADRKSEQRRIRSVLNNHIIRGGHLSAQATGALRDFVAIDHKTDKPAVVHFPVLADDPYRIDVETCAEIIAKQKPELIILGKSMVLYREPVSDMRSLVDDLGIDCLIMYDMAHVLGLVGPHFQRPFLEGADVVTGSTHKTYFGTQRGVVAGNWEREDSRFELWEAIQRRAFPGSVSNHHLGTLVGLLFATYEMKAFKDDYQREVLANAKALAQGLKDCGMDVAGDPAISYTETHQVILNVGYARGPEIARRLEDNNIVVNYQAMPEEEGFTAAGAIRLGVSEMTRFGMTQDDFKELAQFIHDVVISNEVVKEEVSRFRKQFQEMKYCFTRKDFGNLVEKLYELI